MEPDAATAPAAAPPPPPPPAPAAPAAGAAPPQPPVKRRRGRPRKSELPPGGAPAKPPTDPMKPKKQRKRKGEAVAPAASVDVSMIGQQVTGVLDGTFDAGYLLTVRVGASDTILRGVVFSPGLSVPVSRVNDVAPGVKLVRREDRAPPKLPISAKPPPPPPLPAPLAVKLPVRPFATLPPASQIPPTQAVLENAAALFTHAVTATPPAAPAAASAPAAPVAAPPAVTGLVAALQQLPGGGYTPDASTFSQTTFQPI